MVCQMFISELELYSIRPISVQFWRQSCDISPQLPEDACALGKHQGLTIPTMSGRFFVQPWMLRSASTSQQYSMWQSCCKNVSNRELSLLSYHLVQPNYPFLRDVVLPINPESWDTWEVYCHSGDNIAWQDRWGGKDKNYRGRGH